MYYGLLRMCVQGALRREGDRLTDVLDIVSAHLEQAAQHHHKVSAKYTYISDDKTIAGRGGRIRMDTCISDIYVY